MKRLRVALGFFAGAFLVLNGAAHSFLGWKGLSAELAKTQVPADIVQGLAIGWHFGGAAMFAFGCIVILLFIGVAKGQPVSLRPVVVIALVYLGFGSWALAVSDMSPFFLMFVVLGVMLLAASWRPGSA